jgi:alpha-galactosidase
MKKYFITVTLLFTMLFSHAQKFENLSQTPPMGWNSWNKFACNVNEQMLIDMTEAIVSSGLKDVGYEYIVVDDCWHGERDSLGFIHPNKNHFPSGMKALIDYIHSKGLKFGIYSCAGDKTCAGKPGSRGYEYQDAITYAQWGVDYLKYDWCNTEDLNAIGAYTTMRDALYAAKRPIVFSICEWGDNKPWEWGTNIGHLWRTTGDIYDCFDCEKDHGTWSSWGVMKILDMQEGLRSYAGPGHWNDPDMLEVGNGGMTTSENRAHFSMWCMLAAPLMAGNDISNMSIQTLEILSNKDAIAVNQDSLGIQGFRYMTKDSLETWLKPLCDGDWAICFLNRSKQEKDISFNWHTHIIDDVSKRSLDANKKIYKIVDIWSKAQMGTTKNTLKSIVQSHDVLMLRLELQ